MITSERCIHKFDQTLLLSDWKNNLTIAEFEFAKTAGLLKEVPLADLIGFKGFFKIEQTFAEYEIISNNGKFFLQPNDLSAELIQLDTSEFVFAKLDWPLFLLRVKDSNSLSPVNETFKAIRNIDYIGSRIVKDKTVHIFAKKSLVPNDLDKIGSFLSLNRKSDVFFVFLASNSDLFFSNQFNDAFKTVASFGGFSHINAQFKIAPHLIYKPEFHFFFQEIVNSCGPDVLVADKGSLQIYLGDKEIATGDTDSVATLIHLMLNTNRDCSINEITYDVLKKSSLTDASKTVRDFKYNTIKKIESEHGKNSLVSGRMREVISNTGVSNYGKVRLNTNNVSIVVIDDKSISTLLATFIGFNS